ncbi:MAG: SRPBCC family protein [bacterium]
MAVHRAEQAIEISAGAEACFEAIVDYETFPAWQGAVKNVEVLSRDGDGLGEIVSFRVDADLREVTYSLRYRYDRPGRVEWEFVEGDDVAHVRGEYRFEPKGEATVATYVLGIAPGMPVPGFVVNRMNRQVMWRSVRELRDEVERRAGVRAVSPAS